MSRILEQGSSRGRTDVHRFLVVIEGAEGNCSVSAPDLPGCVATGETRAEVERNRREALPVHPKGFREDHLPSPESQSIAEHITVS